MFSYSVTFWLGLLALGGFSLAIEPRGGGSGLHGARRAAGRLAAGQLAGGLRGRGGVGPRCRSGSGRIELPAAGAEHRGDAAALSAIDWALAGAVLYVLLPSGSVPFLAFLGAFLAAILIGMASHVPGGLGVFEGLMVLLLKPYLSSAAVAAGAGGLSGPSITCCRLPSRSSGCRSTSCVSAASRPRRSRQSLGRLTEQVTPRLFGLLTFFSGSILLFSGRHAGGARTPRTPRSLAAAGRDRGLALHRQRRRGRRCSWSRRGWHAGSTPRTTSPPARSGWASRPRS